MYNFSFICRASKIDKKGFAPIELSIIINGTRTYVILPMKFEPTLFNKMMASKRNNEVLEYTSSVRTKLNKCIAEMTANNIAITAHSLKEYFKNGGIKTYLLFDIAEEFLEYHSKKTANCASEVMKKYRLAIDKFKRFIGNVELKTITPQHIEEFKIELKQTYKFEGSTTYHLLARIKTMFTYAFNKAYIKVNPMMFVDNPKVTKEVEFLTNEEVARIEKKEFNNDRLNKVRDLFLFQCYTALSFADMQLITFVDVKNEDGMYYIKKLSLIHI